MGGDAEEAAGRALQGPTHFPPRLWWRVAKGAGVDTLNDNVPLIAAGCAFYTLLAIFPGITILVSLYGLLFDVATVAPQLEALRPLLPDQAFAMVADRVEAVVSKPQATLGWGLALSSALALWSTAAGVKSMMTALNIVYQEPERRNFIQFSLIALLLTLGAVVGVIVTLTVVVGLPALLSFAWLGRLGEVLVTLLSWTLLGAGLVLGLGVLYRYGPSRRHARWRWITPGSLVTVILWLIVAALYSFYVANFAAYDATYGPLGAVIGAMMWFYVSAVVILFGAEINAQLELHTSRDTTVGPDRPMGQRGAHVANTVVGR
ncbi:YihY/virulence factor BrkB family protein [Geminicoccaceae bacterium 1502E]|nr:YihY/virulence factor BrkB family protein [Geminicoccaceae bacterium 1502E]